jgi:hypothetical protein
MAVRVNKSAFNIREKLNELTKRFGLKGSELAAAETVQEARDLVSAGRKNLLINGDMRIAQRGTSGQKVNNSYGGYLSVDRWAVYYDDTTIAQTDVTINGQPKKACKVTASATNGRAYVYQKIENSSRLLGDGTPFSISFWARASKPERRIIEWRYYDNGNENNGSNTIFDTIDISTEWKHFKLENVSIVDANHNATRDGGLWMYNASGNDIGTGFWFEFTEVQVELGKNATEFEYRSYGEELALCQRYYYKIAPGTSNTDIGTGFMSTTTGALVAVQFPTTMRTAPQVGDFESSAAARLYIGYQNTTINATSIAYSDASIHMGRMSLGLAATGTVGNGIAFRTRETDGFVAFSAEL